MILQQTMLPTIMALAKPTITNDSLGAILAVLVRALDLLGRHAATQPASEMQRCFAVDVMVLEGARGEMRACVDEAEVGFWEGSAD